MSMFTASPNARRLTAAEKAQYARDGYVKDLPIFDSEQIAQLQKHFYSVCDLLPDGIEIGRVNCWHKANRWAYELCCAPAVLDYVEDLAGPSFYLWGAQYFCKFPGDGTVVPWHQDAQYWPLSPRKAVTVWLALFDTDETNGAMQVVQGSHRKGEKTHHQVSGAQYSLNQAIDAEAIATEDIVTFNLKAGQLSLHDDGLIHGSGPNESARVRAGLALRYSPADVKCDLSVWPNFEAYPVRGDDVYMHNPVGKIPSSDGYTTSMFPHSSEFS